MDPEGLRKLLKGYGPAAGKAPLHPLSNFPTRERRISLVLRIMDDWKGRLGDPESLLRKHIKARPQPISEVVEAGALKPAFAGLVMSCLEKSPLHRPGSMEQIVGAFVALG